LSVRMEGWPSGLRQRS